MQAICHINFSIHSTPPGSFKLYNNKDEIKGIDHLKMNMLSSYLFFNGGFGSSKYLLLCPTL